MKVDLFEFARGAHEAEGEIPVSRLTRVDSPDPVGAFRWSAVGSRFGRDQDPHLDLQVEGSVVMTCQRCLQPMRQPIAIASTFLIVADEATAETLDDDDAIDVLVGAPDFDLDELVEDEVILALPIAPKHDLCPGAATEAPTGVARPSPFAALAGVKWRTESAPADSNGDDETRH